MKTELHKANSRGYFDHGWLQTHHTFSFADYFNRDRMHFGALRVLNDDTVAPVNGFGLHPHSNMEIVTIPIAGELTHGDSMGHAETIKHGEIQVMSAGTGVRHSEMNRSKDTAVEFLQIWVIPEEENVEPRYDSATILDLLQQNEITTIVSPYPGDGKGLWVHQQAWFSVGYLDKGTLRRYDLKSKDSYGVYAFIINGAAQVGGVLLGARDGLGLSEITDGFDIQAMAEDTRILLIEVPDLA